MARPPRKVGARQPSLAMVKANSARRRNLMAAKRKSEAMNEKKSKPQADGGSENRPPSKF